MKKKINFICPYCNKKYSIKDLYEKGNVDVLKSGLSIQCPHCEQFYLEKDKTKLNE